MYPRLVDVRSESPCDGRKIGVRMEDRRDVVAPFPENSVPFEAQQIVADTSPYVHLSSNGVVAFLEIPRGFVVAQRAESEGEVDCDVALPDRGRAARALVGVRLDPLRFFEERLQRS